MDKVAIQVSGDPSFFNEVKEEAARLDRSPSWLLVYCVGTTLPKLASTIVAMPAKDTSIKAKRRIRTFFVPRELVEVCGRLAARLGMSADEVLAFAWQAGRDGLRAMPSS